MTSTVEDFTENDMAGAENDIGGVENDGVDGSNMGGAEDTVDGAESIIDGTANPIGDEGNNELAELTENTEDQPAGHVEDAGAKTGEKKWPGWPGDNVFRILVPSHKVGSIIGRKGEFIKKMCEESKSRIKILDASPGSPERAVLFRS